MNLRSFREEIQKHTGEDCTMRPFVCDGDPFKATVFIVGTNAASKVPFWCYWNDESGFDKLKWLKSLPRISNTRRRIEWIVESAQRVRILETNLYCVPSTKAVDLRKSDKRSDAFEFMLKALSPRIILLHGKPAKEYFETYHHCESPTEHFSPVKIHGKKVEVAAVKHLFNRPKEHAHRLGETLRSLEKAFTSF